MSTTRQYHSYASLFDELRQAHPQRCDLDRAEFAFAVAHPSTVMAENPLDEQGSEFPQLVVPDVFGWLNSDFYRHRFPNAMNRESLMHLSVPPGTQIGARTSRELVRLALDEGVVLVDGPSDGRFSVNETSAMLRDVVGPSHFGEPERLGTQTYWSGPTGIEGLELAPDPIPVREGARRIDLVGANGDGRTGAFLRDSLVESEVEAMCDLYAAAYEVLSDHPCAQGVSPSEFRDMLLASAQMEKLVFQTRGEVESICLITPDLASLSWINLEFYERRFADLLTMRRVHWYPAIATDPSKAGGRNATELVQLIAKLYEATRSPAVILFDTPDLNSAFLPAYLDEIINAMPRCSVQFEVIGSHDYYAIPLH